MIRAAKSNKKRKWLAVEVILDAEELDNAESLINDGYAVLYAEDIKAAEEMLGEEIELVDNEG